MKTSSDMFVEFCRDHFDYLEREGVETDLLAAEVILALMLAIGRIVQLADCEGCQEELLRMIAAELPHILSDAIQQPTIH